MNARQTRNTPSGPGSARDLAALTAAERDVLQLLARGHTAKSIARTLGLGEGTVNLRLRQARRKTGVGSSRELARLAAAATNAEAVGPTSATPPRRQIRRAAGLALAFSVGAVLVLALTKAGDRTRLGRAPRVVSTYPADHAMVAPGKLTLRVTFDQAMHPHSYSFVDVDPQTYPHDCATYPAQSPDLKTFTLECVVAPHRRFEVGFNGGAFRNFVSADGRVSAEPGILRFSTR